MIIVGFFFQGHFFFLKIEWRWSFLFCVIDDFISRRLPVEWQTRDKQLFLFERQISFLSWMTTLDKFLIERQLSVFFLRDKQHFLFERQTCFPFSGTNQLTSMSPIDLNFYQQTSCLVWLTHDKWVYCHQTWLCQQSKLLKIVAHWKSEHCSFIYTTWSHYRVIQHRLGNW